METFFPVDSGSGQLKTLGQFFMESLFNSDPNYYQTIFAEIAKVKPSLLQMKYTDIVSKGYEAARKILGAKASEREVAGLLLQPYRQKTTVELEAANRPEVDELFEELREISFLIIYFMDIKSGLKSAREDGVILDEEVMLVFRAVYDRYNQNNAQQS